MFGDTIVTLSTPPGQSGIAVIRLSGRGAVDILDSMAEGASRWESHTLHKRLLHDGSGEPLDDVLAVVMRAPNSYTGEDVVEISCHGSMQVVSDVIEEVLRLGAEAAGPGEFTKRAFLNGRMDLAQAEAIADLISAETKLQRKVAIEHLEGALSRKVREIEELLLEQLARVEVSIDFSEEDVEDYSVRELRELVSGAGSRIEGLLESEVAGGKLRRGIRVTILGPRNAGKSSLYNALLGEERAIVSPVPGTTRDVLRERIHIGGFTYFLEDTAGMAETGCEIEAKGISMGRRAAEAAELVLFVIDGSEEIPAEAISWFEGLHGWKALCVINKIDLGLRLSEEEAATLIGAEGTVAVSSVTGEGLERLREWIYERTVGKGTVEITAERIAVNARQGAALKEALEALGRLRIALDGCAPPEILSVEIRAAAGACGRITGRSIEDRVLDSIFSRFCVGK